MYRDGYFVAERQIIEDVDAEEEDNIQKPAPDWNGIWFEEERGVLAGKLVGPCKQKSKEELSEGYKQALIDVQRSV